ncbi:MAG TPA: hypothetical protein VJN02_11370 [Gammaproteobacteria bacterium]|nr:hypothetical protein [Gammaproteobacteria bacterium]
MFANAYTSSETAKICTLTLRNKDAERAYLDIKNKPKKENDPQVIQQTHKELETLLNKIKIARDAQFCQMKMAEELADAYTEGRKDTPVDVWEADKYRQLAAKLKAEIDEQPLTQIKKPTPPLQTSPKPKKPVKKNFRTAMVYLLTGWYTSFRLFIIYINRTLAILEKYDPDKFRRFLPKWFSIFGLSYGMTFLFDWYIILRSTFRAPTPEETKLSRWTRFKNVLTKGSRPNRLLNDGIWFTINMIAIFLTGGLSIAIGFAGFIFDEIHEIFKPTFSYYKHHQITKKIQLEIDTVKKDANYCGPILRKLQASSGDLQNIEQNVSKLAILEHIQTQQKNQEKSTLLNGIRTISGTTLILVGVFFMIYPPSFLPAAALIGIGLTIVGGSIFTGLFYKIGNLIKSKVISKKEDIPINIDMELKELDKQYSSYDTMLRRLHSDRNNDDGLENSSDSDSNTAKIPSTIKSASSSPSLFSNNPGNFQENPYHQPPPGFSFS